jgi:hypothetical protein
MPWLCLCVISSLEKLKRRKSKIVWHFCTINRRMKSDKKIVEWKNFFFLDFLLKRLHQVQLERTAVVRMPSNQHREVAKNQENQNF